MNNENDADASPALESLTAEKIQQRERGREWSRRQATKSKPSKVCFTCGGEHYARVCPQTICHWCAKRGHLARDCQFGKTLRPEDQYVLCSASNGAGVACFVRRFIMPLHCASPDFDPDMPLDEGRVDVGCRTVTASLFRSEAYRRNTEIRLIFGESGNTTPAHQLHTARTAIISGGLIRGLQPHEQAVAVRLRQCLESKGAVAHSCIAGDDEPAGESHAPSDGVRGLRQNEGLRCIHGGLAICLRDCLRHCVAGSAVVLLSETGTPIQDLMPLLRLKLETQVGQMHQVTVVLGDHKGLTQDELDTVSKVVQEQNCEIMHCSLGPVTLLGSHCITLFHHYLDNFLHHCPSKLFDIHPAVSKSRKQCQQRGRPKRGAAPPQAPSHEIESARQCGADDMAESHSGQSLLDAGEMHQNHGS